MKFSQFEMGMIGYHLERQEGDSLALRQYIL